MHPARVAVVDPDSDPDSPLLVEVVTGWSLFAAAEPTTRLRAQLSASDSKWDELAGWSEDPCHDGAQSADLLSGAVGRGGLTGEDGNAGAKTCDHGLVVGMVPRANFETMQDGMLTSFQL